MSINRKLFARRLLSVTGIVAGAVTLTLLGAHMAADAEATEAAAATCTVAEVDGAGHTGDTIRTVDEDGAETLAGIGMARGLHLVADCPTFQWETWPGGVPATPATSEPTAAPATSTPSKAATAPAHHPRRDPAAPTSAPRKAAAAPSPAASRTPDVTLDDTVDQVDGADGGCVVYVAERTSDQTSAAWVDEAATWEDALLMSSEPARRGAEVEITCADGHWRHIAAPGDEIYGEPTDDGLDPSATPSGSAAPAVG